MAILKWNSSLVTAVIGLTFLTIGFQNCTKTKFAVDEFAKQKALDDGSVFEGGGVDPGTQNGNTGGEDPGVPGGDAGKDPGVPGSSTPGMDPSVPKLSMDIEMLCPLTQAHKVEKIFALAGPEVKVVFTKTQYDIKGKSETVLCEVHGVKSQMLQNRKIDISSCAAALDANRSASMLSAYIVEEAVTSEFEKFKFNDGMAYYRKNAEVRVVWADMNDKANLAGCDMVGDPLLVQLGTSTPQSIELTAPDKGVYFDLLGRRANHVKVLTSWFANAKSENYFLVLPDAQGQVHGIDELFGDATYGPDRRYSKQGFQALAKHDENRDNLINSDDGVYADLKLWKDENLDGIAQESELSGLEAKGVMLIDLRYDRRFIEKDQHGNMTKFKSIVIMNDGSYGLVYDLWLRYIPN